MVPAEIAGTYGIVCDSVEGDLLYVKVSVEEKTAAVAYDKRQKDHGRKTESVQKCVQKVIAVCPTLQPVSGI